MNTLTLKYSSDSIPALLKKLSNTFEGMDVDLVNTSSEDCKKTHSGISVLLHDELLYPEHSELDIISILKVDEQKLCILGKNQDSTLNHTKLKDYRNQLGKVYLVGGGQSSIDLLTVKALTLLREADIVFYDSLIDESILSEATGELVFVGKRAGAHHKDQHDINKLLLNAALTHKKIVRIKGGDPMIFGHAGEEIIFLEREFVTVEVVPGITSALGAAAVTNTSLTLRNVSDSVSFCTAHQKNGIPVPNTSTIVYFMGAANMKNLGKELLKNGKPGSTPVKLIYNIGAKDQEIYQETIDSIAHQDKKYKAPLISIVGEVADKKSFLKALDHKPKILFTGTTIAKYMHLGYVHHHPMIELVKLNDFKEVDEVIHSIQCFDWLLFTSAYSVKFFFERLYELNMDSRTLGSVKIASIGSVTSGKLKSHGIIPDLQATEESSDGLIALFKAKNIVSESIVIPRSDLAHNTLPEGLMRIGNQVRLLTIYRNTKPVIEKKVDPESFDKVIFTSPSCVNNYISEYGGLPQNPELIARGKETQKAINTNQK